MSLIVPIRDRRRRRRILTLKNFGRDRRYPIVNRFHDPGTPLLDADAAVSKGAAMAKAGASDF